MEVKEIAAKLRELADAIEEEKAPKISLEDVRAVLAIKSRDGKTLEVRKLINTYGVTKLSDVPEEKYQELMAKAEAL
jgi:hypothetical protein